MGAAPGSKRDIFYFYGTFSRSMLTMFEIMLANWSPACRVLTDNIGEGYGSLILMYRCVAGFAVLNVISAVFIQQTMSVAKQDNELMMLERRRASEAYRAKLILTFGKMDSSGDGKLSSKEFHDLIQDRENRLWMSVMGIDPFHLQEFWEVLDQSSNREPITADQFVEGVSRLRGEALSVDIAYLKAIMKNLMAKVDSLAKKAPDNNKAKELYCAHIHSHLSQHFVGNQREGPFAPPGAEECQVPPIHATRDLRMDLPAHVAHRGPEGAVVAPSCELKEKRFKPGDRVQGLFRPVGTGTPRTGLWFTAKISKPQPDGSYVVDWNDGDTRDRVKQKHELRKCA